MKQSTSSFLDRPQSWYPGYYLWQTKVGPSQSPQIGTANQCLLRSVIGKFKYHLIQSKSEWNVDHVFQGPPCIGNLLLETCSRKPLRNVLYWGVGEYSNWYDEYDIGIQSGIKSTRYPPGSLKPEKEPTLDSARAMIGSPFSCTS